MKDPYEVLGVPKSASAAEIKKAFRAKSKITHPDRNGGNTELQSQINVAYSLLSDDSKRAQFDQTGNARVPPTDEAARTKLTFLIMQAIGQGEDQLFDLVAIARDALRNELSGLAIARSRVVRAQKKFKRALKQLKGPPDNFLHYAIEDQLKGCDRALAAATVDEIMLERAIEMLAEFSFVMEAEAAGGFLTQRPDLLSAFTVRLGR